MKHQSAKTLKNQRTNAERRQFERFDITLEVNIRFLPDGTPVKGSAIEVGPNGMRLITSVPLAEAAYIHISFESASNNTFCEGRVVWTQRMKDSARYESGVDIQRWGGSVPLNDIVESTNSARPKKDRRRTAR